MCDAAFSSQVVARDTGMPVDELSQRVSSLLAVLPDTDTNLASMKQADMVRHLAFTLVAGLKHETCPLFVSLSEHSADTKARQYQLLPLVLQHAHMDMFNMGLIHFNYMQYPQLLPVLYMSYPACSCCCSSVEYPCTCCWLPGQVKLACRADDVAAGCCC